MTLWGTDSRPACRRKEPKKPAPEEYAEDWGKRSCWENLAGAVVAEAVEEYRAARRRLHRCPACDPAARKLESLEQFFRGRWFAQLTDLNGEALLRDLRKEAEENRVGKSRNRRSLRKEHAG